MVNRAWLLIAVGWTLTGCSHDAATIGPSNTTGPSSSASAIGPLRLTGTVIDDDRVPVAGASITVFPYFATPSPPAVTTTSNGGGAYDVAFSGNVDARVVAERDGYERMVPAAFVTPNASVFARTLQLQKMVRMIAGDTLDLPLRLNDPPCGSEDEWICRIVRIAAPRAGTITLTVTADDPGLRPALGIGSVAWPTLPQYPCCPNRITRAVAAGDEVIAEVMLPWTSPLGRLTLRSAIE